jgi:hypothetical protein
VVPPRLADGQYPIRNIRVLPSTHSFAVTGLPELAYCKRLLAICHQLFAICHQPIDFPATFGGARVGGGSHPLTPVLWRRHSAYSSGSQSVMMFG